MNACIYTSRGEEVPLGVECALPYLEPVATAILQQPDSGEHEGMRPLPPLATAHSTPSRYRRGAALADWIQHLVKGDHHAATL